MATLIYATNVSLDGYIEDSQGAFDWGPPDDDLYATYTALLRSAGTFLYGRRLYEMMAGWETDPTLAEQSDLTADFANAWQAADKVVYSTTLTTVSTATTRVKSSLGVKLNPANAVSCVARRSVMPIKPSSWRTVPSALSHCSLRTRPRLSYVYATRASSSVPGPFQSRVPCRTMRSG